MRFRGTLWSHFSSNFAAVFLALLGAPVAFAACRACFANLVERCVKRRTTHQNRIKKTHKTLISVSDFINDINDINDPLTFNRWSRSWSLLKRAVAGIAPYHWPGGMHEAIKYPLQGRRMAEGPKITFSAAPPNLPEPQ